MMNDPVKGMRDRSLPCSVAARVGTIPRGPRTPPMISLDVGPAWEEQSGARDGTPAKNRYRIDGPAKNDTTMR